MGFVDNVVSRRVERASLAVQAASSETAASPRERKRRRLISIDEPEVIVSNSSDYASLGYNIASSAEADLQNAESPTPYFRGIGVISGGEPSTGMLVSPNNLVESRCQIAEPEDGLSIGATDSSSQDNNRARDITSSLSASGSEESIPALQKQLETLNQYGSELLELSLAESHAKALEQINLLEKQVEQVRRREAEVLLKICIMTFLTLLI